MLDLLNKNLRGIISDVTLKIGMNWICREKKVINGTTMKFIFLPMGLIRKYFQNFHSYYVLIVPIVYHSFIIL